MLLACHRFQCGWLQSRSPAVSVLHDIWNIHFCVILLSLKRGLNYRRDLLTFILRCESTQSQRFLSLSEQCLLKILSLDYEELFFPLRSFWAFSSFINRTLHLWNGESEHLCQCLKLHVADRTWTFFFKVKVLTLAHVALECHTSWIRKKPQIQAAITSRTKHISGAWNQFVQRQGCSDSVLRAAWLFPPAGGRPSC